MLISLCLHGLTQNANESFNSMIWKRSPKYRYCSLSKLKLSVYDSIGNFNYGTQASLDTYKLQTVNPGCYTTNVCNELNIRRKYTSGHKSMDSSKLRKKIIRNKHANDKNVRKEGTTYEAGGFN